MATHVITLTAGTPGSDPGAVSGFTNADYAAFLAPSFGPFGSIDVSDIDGFDIAAIQWSFASHGNSSFEIAFESKDSTGDTPPRYYITSVSFTGDGGAVETLGISTDPILRGPDGSGNFYHRWIWTSPQGFSPNTDPFTPASVYTITIETTLNPVVGDFTITAGVIAVDTDFGYFVTNDFAGVGAAGSIVIATDPAGIPLQVDFEPDGDDPFNRVSLVLESPVTFPYQDVFETATFTWSGGTLTFNSADADFATGDTVQSLWQWDTSEAGWTDGDVVHVVLSFASTAVTIPIPDVTGLNLKAARLALSAASISPIFIGSGNVTSGVDASVPPCTVLSQNPVGGTMVGVSTLVNLEVSTNIGTVATLADVTSADWSLMLDSTADADACPGAGLGQIVQGIADIEQCIGIIITTIPGSDPLRPNFGLDPTLYQDFPINVAVPAIVGAVTAQVTAWEPRITVTQVQVAASSQANAEQGSIDVTVFWQLKANPAVAGQTTVTI